MNKMVVPFSGGIRLRAGAASPADARAGLPGAQGGRRELLRGELMQAAIYGLAGTELSDDERGFFRDADAAGYILFRRNCATPEQLLRLTDALRDLSRARRPAGADRPGGRAGRADAAADLAGLPGGRALRPALSGGAVVGDRGGAVQRPGARADACAMCGINVNCLPLLDVRQEGASDIIGDRALGSEPMQVAALGRAVLDGMASAGVVGVIKHMPGHGRALVDSHKELPVVDRERRGAGGRPRAVRAARLRRRWG